MADRNFPPELAKHPAPTSGEDLQLFITRLVARLNDYQDIDITFDAPATNHPVPHQLGRIPSQYEVIWADAEVAIFANTAYGWGYNVVYFQASAAAHVRVRLR